jgi:hypothetical protein
MSEPIRAHSFPDETYQIGIDFDGVIHANSKGFYDGSVYDDPIPGARAALEALSKKFVIVVYSAKARQDRMLIDGKTGIELIWDWLKKHNMSSFVKEVTAEKPRAVFYIDDKAIRFNGSWNDTFLEIDKLGYTNND